ncbi:hypothetical protein WA026_021525 [Henosepilachna vigintioctopunctata]|uniref:Uncharacterized protein n=1 Tax=Henosepilachna vigintioctopunctata TaxID=420089 RepID=A0AAW1VHM9_9CUCU
MHNCSDESDVDKSPRRKKKVVRYEQKFVDSWLNDENFSGQLVKNSLNQARKAAEDSDYSASEGPQGKGHRSKFLSATAAAAATSKYSLTDISSDDENDKNGNSKKPATEMPKMNKKIQKTTPMIPPTSRIDRSDKEHPNNKDQSLEVQSSGNNMTSDALSDLQWGKTTQKQLLGYDKGERMSKLFPPPVLSAEMTKLKPIKLTVASMPESLKNTPLQKILELEEKENIVIIPAESMLQMIQSKAEEVLQEKARKVVSDIFLLQNCNEIFSQEVMVTKEIFTFYQEKICCDAKTALNLNLLTILQSDCSEWFAQRVLRITVSNGYKLKGQRFDVEKVVTDMLYPKLLFIFSRPGKIEGT